MLSIKLLMYCEENKTNNFRKVQVNSGKGVNKMKGMLNEISPLTLSIDEMINQGLLKRDPPKES